MSETKSSPASAPNLGLEVHAGFVMVPAYPEPPYSAGTLYWVGISAVALI